jgi:tetratricopeptide (TPR) repeat protein
MSVKISLSTVSDEFRAYRDALRGDLTRHNVEVKVQEDFKDLGGVTLDKLDRYIADCAAVVHLVGDMTGAAAKPASTQAILDKYPDLAAKLPPLREPLADGAAISYTQWEAWLALYHGKALLIAKAADAAPRGPNYAPTDASRAAQQAHLDRLRAVERFPSTFTSPDNLAKQILATSILDLLVKAHGAGAAKPIVLPYPSIGSLFKGRNEFKRRLRESLSRGGQTAITSQALYGLGGIGKTRAAVEYAWAHADQYNALLFVLAQTPETLRRDLAALAGVLVPKLEATDDAVRLKASLDWLKTNPGWFLILDNVDTPEAMAEAEKLLRDLAGGRVVITSRLANFSANVRPLALDVLAIEDAAAFLLERTDDRRRVAADDEAKAREAAVELGQLALALEQAAALIAKRRLTFAEYVKEWREKGDADLAWFDQTVTGYPRAVAATWQTSVARLSKPGQRLLQRLAWLAPEKVPESLLDTPIPGAETEDLHEDLDDLTAYSLVQRDAEGPFFLIHRLVQDVTRRSLGEDRQRSMVEALNWVNAAFVGDPLDVRAWPVLDPLAPHAMVVAESGHAANIVEPTALLMNSLGRLLNAKARHREAEPLMLRALAIDEASYGPQHPNVARDLDGLAHLFYAINRLAEAEPLLRRALAIDEASYGPDHPNVAIRLNNLTLLLQDTNCLAEAEPLMRRALTIDEAIYGPNHPNVAIRLNNLGQLLQATDRLVEAEPLMRRALAMGEVYYGPDHPKVAIRLNNLASLLQTTSRLAEAEPLIRRALAIDEASYGPDHPDVARDLINLAQLLKATNRLAEADPLMRRALAILEKSLGPEHPRTVGARHNLAALRSP